MDNCFARLLCNDYGSGSISIPHPPRRIEEMDNRIRSKWDFLLQCRSDIRAIVGNTKLIGGRTSYNVNHETVFDFITKKGVFSYNEATHEFKTKLEIG